MKVIRFRKLDISPVKIKSTVYAQYEKSKKHLSHILIGANSLLLIICFYLIASYQYWLRYFDPIESGLLKVAITSDTIGTITRKTSADSLLLPLKNNSNVYNQDLIKTESSSSLEIQFPNNLSLYVKENSIVKVKMFNNTLLLKITTGEVQITSKINQKIKIQRGAAIEDFEINSGMYTFKSDSLFGVQITAHNSPHNNSEKKTSTQAESKEEESKTDKKQTQQASVDKDTVDLGMKDQNIINYELPTPKDTTIFLRRKPTGIMISASKSCPNSCQLKIFKNHALWKSVSYSTAQPTIFHLAAKDADIAAYDWIFITESSETRGQFSVKNFTNEELSLAIKNERIVEIQ